MTTHVVHIYATVRVKVTNVEAGDQLGACKLAEEHLPAWLLHRQFDTSDMPCHIESIDYDEEILAYMVDVVGDDEYELSNVYEYETGTGELVCRGGIKSEVSR